MHSDQKRKEGLCPMTPEETSLVLRALGVDPSFQIYIAAGEIYGGDRRMVALASAYPKLVCSNLNGIQTYLSLSLSSFILKVTERR